MHAHITVLFCILSCTLRTRIQTFDYFVRVYVPERENQRRWHICELPYRFTIKSWNSV